MEIIGLLLMLLFYLIQVFYYRSYFRHIWVEKENLKGHNPSVSIIICGKNEAENLKMNLPSICDQNYSNFEVLYMDDHSTDNTAEVLSEMCKKYSHLHYLKASDSIKDKQGKKWALEEARAMVKNEVILVTDADCSPSSNLWISLMASKFDKEVDAVLGIGRYHKQKGIVNSLVQYETLFTAMSYLGLASAGAAYMGVGRNLAYRTSVTAYRKEKGRHLMSGDDDLFLQSFVRAKNTAICVEPEAHTISVAPIDFKSWVSQKTRHYSTAFHYPGKVSFILLFLKLSFYLPNVIFLCLLFSVYSNLAIGLFVLRLLIWLVYMNKIRRELHFSRPLYLLPCYEIFFCLFDSWITIKNLMTKPRQWK